MDPSRNHSSTHLSEVDSDYQELIDRHGYDFLIDDYDRDQLDDQLTTDSEDYNGDK